MDAKDTSSSAGPTMQPSSIWKVFDEFKYWKTALEEVFKDTSECFGEIVKICKAPSRGKIEEALLRPKDRGILKTFRQVDTVPKVLILGQSNCGKTSLINELLGFRLLPTADVTTANRVVKIKYSEEEYFRVVSDDGSTPPKSGRFGEGKTVPSEYINLTEEECKNGEERKSSVEVGIKHPCLKSGVMLFDVPSFSKDNTVRLVQRECVEGVLPLVVYILDGNYGLRLRDQDMLSTLYDLSPHLKIIYVCNKVDIDTLAEDMDQPSDESEDEGGETVASFDKKQRTFKMLVNFGFQGESERMNTTEFYHGISTKMIRQDRKQKANSEYTKDFGELHRCFSTVARAMLKKHTASVVWSLHSAQIRCFRSILAPGLQRRGVKETRWETGRMKMEDILKDVDALLEGRNQQMAYSVEKAIKNATPKIIKTVREMEYSPVEIGQFVHKDEMTIQLANQVRAIVAMKVTQSIRDQLVEEFKIGRLIEEITRKVNEVDVLGLKKFSMETQFIGLYEEIRWRINNHLMSMRVKDVVKKFAHYFGGVTVNAEWREGIAKEALRCVKAGAVVQLVGDEIRQKISDHRGEVENFMKCLEDLAGFSEYGGFGGDCPKYARRLCRSLCRTAALLDCVERKQLWLHKVDDLFRSGQRTDIYFSIKEGDGVAAVLRVQKRAKRLGKDASVLIALNRYLPTPTHAEVLPATALTTVNFGDQSGESCIACEVPFMDADLWHELAEKDFTKKYGAKERLHFARDVAVTCKTMSLAGFSLQDLRITNVLIRKGHSRRHAIVNTLKPRDDNTLYPDGKPPFHVPPEDQRSGGGQCSGYRSDTDHSTVYAFGVLLWLLVLGRYVRIPHHEDHAESVKVVEEEMKTARVDDNLKKLITRCLSFEKGKRPCWDEILAELNKPFARREDAMSTAV